MLLEFRVKNYRSIKEEAVITMLANRSYKEQMASLLDAQGKKVLPVVGIFGANASGKSNVIKAAMAALNTIRKSNSMEEGMIMEEMIPFAFDKDTAKEPCCFDFDLIENGIRYQYGFKATKTEVVEEYLFAYLSKKKSQVFKREKESYDIKTPFREELQEFSKYSMPNRLFLSLAAFWKSKTISPVFYCFRDKFTAINTQAIKLIFPYMLSIDKNKDLLKKQLLEFLHRADFHIHDYVLETENPLPFEDMKDEKAIKDALSVFLKHKMNVIHEVNGERFGLDFKDESEGTQTFLAISLPIRASLGMGSTLFVDEIDTNLHHLLTQHLISLYMNDDDNPKGAQLIFNAHDTLLMDKYLLRRDQIYLTEKKKETDSTILYKLEDASPRKGSDIPSQYLIGRYGAIPKIF